MKKLITFFFLFTVITVYSQKATNSWNGSFNAYWHNDNNWSLGHIPTSTEDVVIPNGMPRYPTVDFYDESIKSLVIQSGAYVRVKAYTLTVSGDIQVYGLIDMDHTNAKISCNNITWYSGSQAETTGNCEFFVYGIWEFASGANVQLDNGRVQFNGTSNQYIRSKDADCYFNNIYLYKSAGVFGLSGQSTATCIIKGYFSCGGSNYSVTSPSSQKIQIGNYLQVSSSSISLALDNGTIEFTGNQFSCVIYAQPNSYINNLIVNTGSSNVILSQMYGNTFEVKGNMTINSGALNPSDINLKVGGNWINNVGPSGFMPNSSTVIFNGSGHQYCSNETFHNLEVNKSSGALRMDGTYVVCAAYNWTAGAVDVLSGSFTANELLDNAIQGSFYVNIGGAINLHNPDGYIDLKGDLYIYGGVFNVYGGTTASYWPYGEDASITMSSGVLDIKEQGIRIYNTSYALNHNITGGNIKCAGYLYNDRADFTPNAGLFEMYGPTGANIRCTNGGRFWNLAIYKVDSRDGLEVKPFTDRDGIYYDGTRAANTATAVSNITTSANLYVEGGTFDLGAYDFTSTGGSAVIFGNLKMTNPANDFSVNWDVQWMPGSTAEITNGNFWVNRHWYFENGTEAQISPGNTLHLTGASTQFFYSKDANAEIGSLSVENISSSVWMHSTSTQLLHVAGTMEVLSGALFQIQGKSLQVDGVLDIASGGTMHLSSSGGGQLTNNSDFELNGNLFVGTGNVMIHGMFDLMHTGKLSIDGGTFINDGSNVTNCNYIYGELTMTAGIYQAEEVVYIASTATTNISGGIIKCRGFIAQHAGNFQPTGGTVEMRGFNDLFVNRIECLEGNYLYNLEINANANSGAILYSDITVQNDLTITSGTLHMSTYQATVQNNVDIFGRLLMTESSCSLTCEEIFWHPGSTDMINNGDIYCHIWTFENGTNAMLEPGNTAHVSGIYNYDPDAEFGHLIWEDWYSKQSNKVSANLRSTEIHGLNVESEASQADAKNPIKEQLENERTSYPRKVSGNCTWLGSGWLHWGDIIVQGTADITSGCSVELGNMISLTTFSDFTLNGELKLAGGNCYVDGLFHIAETGELIIQGGEFIVENGSTSYNNLYGTLTMTDGLFQTDINLRIQSTASTNISGGMIRARVFLAESAGTFEPAGGTVEIQTFNNGYGTVKCSNGNFFNNLNVNEAGNGGGAVLGSDILIVNDLNIYSGKLWFDGLTATVHGNINIFEGGLYMKDPNDVLNAGNNPADEILWTSDATFEWNEMGRINIFGNCTIENGVSHNVKAGQTFAFVGTLNQVFNNLDDATFGTIELAKPSGSLIIPVGSTVECEIYDWTSGIITLNSGTFTANDLVDDGIYGTIKAFGNALVNLYQDAESPIHLYGHLETSGTGTINVYGGNDWSNWGTVSDASVTMNGGTINFADQGILVQDNPPWQFTSNITGGTIKTSGSFRAWSPGFNPSGGTVELYGSGWVELSGNHGGYFNNLLIDKTTGSNVDISDIKVNENLTVVNGSLKLLSNKTLECPGSISLNSYLSVQRGAAIKLGNNSSFNANTGGMLHFSGSEEEKAKLTGITVSDHYDIQFSSGSYLIAAQGIFENMGDQGVNFASGSEILLLTDCEFRNGKVGSNPMLTIDNNQDLVLENITFNGSSKASQFNVRKNVNEGSVFFLDANGDMAGATFEDDTHGRIHWMPANHATEPQTVGNDDIFCADAFYNLTVEDLVVENGGTVDLIAGNSILILPGTRVYNGGKLHAWITESYEFCEQQESMLASVSLDDQEENSFLPAMRFASNDDQYHHLNIYPNPTSGIVNIELNVLNPDEELIIQVYVITGELREQFYYSGAQTLLLDLLGWNPGVYLIRILNGNKSFTGKIIKQ